MNQTASPFYDQGDTHTFSDWLVTSLWNIGVDNPAEFYVGVLPDITSVVARDGQRRAQAQWDKIEELNQAQLTPVGQALKKVMAGHHFVDLAAGRMHLSVVARIVAESFGALSYTGVDLNYGGDSSITNEFRHQGFRAQFLKQEIVSFLKSFQKPGPVTFYLSGVESDAADADSVKSELLDLLQSKTSAGDFVVIGPGTTDFDVTTRKFKKIANDHYHFVFKRKHDGIFGFFLDLLP